MNWKDVNVFQWQQIVNLFTKEKDLTDLDLAVKAVAILNNMTEYQVDSLPMEKLSSLLKGISFIHNEIKPEPQRFIDVMGKRYKCVYDIRRMPAARYIESKHFAQDTTNNLHRIAACMVVPMKKTWFGWIEQKYNASKHEDYSQDLLEAPITAVLGSVVFFYQVFRVWTKISKDYLISEMMKAKMTRYQAEATYQILCDTMDGFTKPNWLLNMKESHWRKLMKSQHYNT
jgi:hypothetical protein